jgi:hypothetical protein
LDGQATYLSWSFIQLSIPNLVVIIGMVVIFVLALVAPFPSHAVIEGSEESKDA